MREGGPILSVREQHAPPAEQELGAGQVQAVQQQGEESGSRQSFVGRVEADLELVRLLLGQVGALGQLDVPVRPAGQAAGGVAQEPGVEVEAAVGQVGRETGEPEGREEGAGQGAEQDSADEGGDGRQVARLRAPRGCQAERQDRRHQGDAAPAAALRRQEVLQSARFVEAAAIEPSSPTVAKGGCQSVETGGGPREESREEREQTEAQDGAARQDTDH